MANNVLTAKLQLRYDTYNHWMDSSLILMPGEVAIATLTLASAQTPPQIGIKVGDGIHYFYELPWIQAIATDVYNWAKQINKPQYAATEIVGLAEYIAAHSSGGGGGEGGNTSNSYKIIYDEASSKYILQCYDEENDGWINTSGAEIDISGILNRLTTIERWANGATNHLGEIELPLVAFIYDEVVTYLNRLDLDDVAEQHQFVTSVVQNNGQITVTRAALSAADITIGTLPTERGGTGLSFVDEDQVLIGSYTGNITTKSFVTSIDVEDRNSFATAGAIIDYVANVTAGLTGAMHFIGESTVVIDLKVNNHVNPQISGYNFNNAQPGDVILANNSQELVWTGSEWRLLGDEGSYAIKGSITNVDVADEANIAQSKIAGLIEALNGKVDKIEGASLITAEEKQKLAGIEIEAQVNTIEHIFVNDVEAIPGLVSGQEKSVNLQIPVLTVENAEKIEGIEAGAQVNTIEHIYVNNVEVNPSTINNVPKVVNIEFTPFTAEEQEKLANIETGAQVNTIESISINDTEYLPDANKKISITLNSDIFNLADIATTGDIKDLLQTEDTYVILDCGSSETVI